MKETNEKNVVKISLSTFFLILAIIAIIIMAFYIYTEKTSYNKEIANLETNLDAKQSEIDELQEKIDLISNTINSGKTINDTNVPTSENVEKEKNKIVKYEFQSGDRAAAQGYPKILKIYELNENELDFEYNSARNFDTSTIDREVKGMARANAEQLYEFDETIDNHQYKLVFEFNESKDTVTVYEYDNGHEMGYINLFR